jgi:hypothetical protein
MKWVRTESGVKAHVAIGRHRGHTLCGIPLAVATGIVGAPPAEQRCGACDHVWREKGRRERPKAPAPRADVYEPKNTYASWEGNDE